MKYKNFKFFVSGMLFLGFVLPQVGFTAWPVQSAEGKQAGAKFCDRLDTRLSNLEKMVSERETKFESRMSEREGHLQKGRSERDKNIQDMRARSLANREERFAKMSGKSLTEEQKKALLEFQETVKKLVADRQKAMDAGRDAFRTGVDKLISERKTKLEALLAQMKSSVEEAVAKAKKDCASGVDPETVAKNMKDSVAKARQTFKDEVAKLPKVSDSMKTLVEAREKVFEKANSDFQAGLEKAKEVLKSKIGQK